MQRRRVKMMANLVWDNKTYFMGTVVCTVVTVLISLLSPILLAEIIDHYIMGGASKMPEFFNAWVQTIGGQEYMTKNLWIMGLLLLAVNVINGVFSFCKGRWSSQLGENVALSLRERLYGHIQHLPFSYHVKAETGDLIQRCTSDVDTVRRFLASQVIAIFNAVMMVALSLVVLFGMNVPLTLWSMILVPALFLFAWLFFRWVIKNFRIADEAEGKMSGVLQESLTGVRVVRAFGKQEYEVEKFDKASTELRGRVFKLCKLLAVYWSGSDLMTMAQNLITLLVCVIYAADGQITVGDLIIFTSYVGQMLWPIRQMGRILSDAGKSFVSLERIDEVLRTPAEPDEPDAIKPSLKGDIVFDDVSFYYDSNRDVLKHMSFTIKKGQTVAILGATGSGKSSVVHLLQRLFEPQEGKITIGGVDIQKIDRKYLRSRIGLVLQEPFLYSKTIRDNVGVAVRAPSQEDIDRAVRDACAAEFIAQSEKGYDTLIGERGVTVSGGQKQRLAIARTLMKDNDLLIFDDSLSAVDTETDAQIRAALKKRSRDVTTIIISHRIVTLSQADLILVMEDGRVTAQGTHQQLIAQGGLYSRIYNIQSALEDEFKQDKGA